MIKRSERLLSFFEVKSEMHLHFYSHEEVTEGGEAMFASDANALSKTTRINMLFDFYESLLTDKQQTILAYYYHEDFSLGEIASEFNISRQAVYDNMKRAEQALESYEDKLGLLKKHQLREQLLQEIEAFANDTDDVYRKKLLEWAEAFRLADQSGKEEVTVHGSI